jgi:uncharacterized protein (TIRG00374 family)
MKKFLLRAWPWLITGLLVVFLIRQGSDLRDFRSVLAQAHWLWLLLAVAAQAGVYAMVAWLNMLLLRHYGVAVPWFRQYSIQLITAFVEAVVPSATISGFVLRARLLKRYGAKPDVTTITTLIETGLISASVLVPVLLAAGLAAGDRAESWGMLAVIGLGMAGLSTTAAWYWRRNRCGHSIRELVSWAGKTWDRTIVRRWPRQLVSWPSTRLLERIGYLLSELRPLLARHTWDIGGILVVRTACETFAFIACFYVFGQSLALPVYLLLYTLTITINTVGTIPGGVGLAEVSLATLFIQFGLEPEAAVAVALTYRATGYWLPRAAGGLLWLWIEHTHASQSMGVEHQYEPEQQLEDHPQTL